MNDDLQKNVVSVGAPHRRLGKQIKALPCQLFSFTSFQTFLARPAGPLCVMFRKRKHQESFLLPSDELRSYPTDEWSACMWRRLFSFSFLNPKKRNIFGESSSSCSSLPLSFVSFHFGFVFPFLSPKGKSFWSLLCFSERNFFMYLLFFSFPVYIKCLRCLATHHV